MLVLIVMIISLALLLALFSGFFPFVRTYGNVMQYSTAYYGAISALERWVLAVRHTGPGFDWESGRESTAAAVLATGKGSDSRIDNFYTYGNGSDTMVWKVHSSTDRIPSAWNGDVDPAFIARDNLDSRNYNMLNYSTTELIPLWTVGVVPSNKYYIPMSGFNLNVPDFSLVGTFRLNPFLFGKFGTGTFGWGWAKLCTSSCPGARVGEEWRDENQVVASWTIKGNYGDTEYTLLPFNAPNFNRGIIEERDTLIRKENIYQNSWTPKEIVFWKNRHPLNHDNNQGRFSLNIISKNEAQLNALGSFARILTNGNVKNSYLTFSLANYLWTQGGTLGRNLYPFLEYEFHTLGGVRISDRFFTIQGEGKVWKYHIKLQLKKPTLKQPALGSFTIIF